MKELLLIRLHENLNKCDWWFHSDSEKYQLNGFLSNVPQTSIKCRIIVFVPCVDISFKMTQLKTQSIKKLVKAIPAALEEELLEEIDTQHFAFSWRKEKDLQHIAVVQKNRIKEWLNKLSDYQIIPDLLIPEIFLLPYVKNRVVTYIDENYVLIRTSQFDGLVIKKSFYEKLIRDPKYENKLATLSDIFTEKPFCTGQFYSHSVVSRLDRGINSEADTGPRGQAAGRRRGSEEKLTEKHIFSWFIKYYPNISYINLLQGNFKKKLILLLNRALFQFIKVLAVSIFVINFFGTISVYSYLNYKNKLLQKQIMSLSLIAKSKLRNFNNYNNAFLSDMIALNKTLKRDDIQIQRLLFNNQSFCLELNAKDIFSLESFNQQLLNNNFVIHQRISAMINDKLHVKYQIIKKVIS